MYKINPELFKKLGTKRSLLTMEEAEGIKYSVFEGWISSPCSPATKFMVATYIEQDQVRYALLTERGVEMCNMSKEEYDNFKRQKAHYEDTSNKAWNDMKAKKITPSTYEKHVANQILYFYGPIVKSAANDPKIIKHIPVRAFAEHPTLGEEILTAYQEVKMAELDAIPAGKSCEHLVKEVKETVESMNKTFNNIEKTMEAKKAFADMFKRDKSL